ncbi:Rha family transcriptional regulator, partial [Paenibacillus campi]|uniref:Rha family transcriptional regulator n=1 Tax=Paenibacillus campi TaxID=3106031 RepID=UPI002AFF45C4
EEFNRLNFEPVKYRDKKNQERDKFLITEHGLNFLAMTYSPAFREKIIREFARMTAALDKSEPLTMHVLIKSVQALTTSQEYLLEQVVEIEARLESQITLNSHQQRLLQQAITERVHGLHVDKVSRRYAFQKLHRDIKDRWEVTSYRDVTQKRLPEVLGFVDKWLGK